MRSANRSLSVEITARALRIEGVDEDATVGLITKSPSPPTVPYRTQNSRSACPSISAEPPSSPAAAESLSPTPREPPSAPDTRRPPHCAQPPRCPFLAALSRTQPPQKRYLTVNQPILEVADDSRLRGDNARNAIGPDVRFSRTSTSPLEGSPASMAASTPARSPSPSPTAVSNVVCRRQLRLRRTGLVLRRHQVRTRGGACLFVLILYLKYEFKHHHTGGLRLRIQLRSGSLPSCRNRSVPTD